MSLRICPKVSKVFIGLTPIKPKYLYRRLYHRITSHFIGKYAHRFRMSLQICPKCLYRRLYHHNIAAYGMSLQICPKCLYRRLYHHNTAAYMLMLMFISPFISS
jgi:hypothetical protein